MVNKLYFGALLASILLLAAPASIAAGPGGGGGGGTGGGMRSSPMGGGMSGPGGSRGTMMPRGQYDQDRDRDRTRDQDTDKTRDRDRDRIHQTDAIYGARLMSPAEIRQYREKLRSMKTAEERNRFIEQHRVEMNARARQQGVNLQGAESRVQERARETNQEREQTQQRQQNQSSGDE